MHDMAEFTIEIEETEIPGYSDLVLLTAQVECEDMSVICTKAQANRMPMGLFTTTRDYRAVSVAAYLTAYVTRLQANEGPLWFVEADDALQPVVQEPDIETPSGTDLYDLMADEVPFLILHEKNGMWVPYQTPRVYITTLQHDWNVEDLEGALWAQGCAMFEGLPFRIATLTEVSPSYDLRDDPLSIKHFVSSDLTSAEADPPGFWVDESGKLYCGPENGVYFAMTDVLGVVDLYDEPPTLQPMRQVTGLARIWVQIMRTGRVHVRDGCGYVFGADLSKRNLAGVSLVGAHLPGANFCKANLVSASLRGANLCGANFTDADLTKVDFQSAALDDATMKRAKVQRTDFRYAGISPERLAEADVDSLLIFDPRAVEPALRHPANRRKEGDVYAATWVHTHTHEHRWRRLGDYQDHRGLVILASTFPEILPNPEMTVHQLFQALELV